MSQYRLEAGIPPVSLADIEAGVNDATAEHTLGDTIQFDLGKMFVYVQVKDAPTTLGSGTGASNGAVMQNKSASNPFIVTCDRSAGLAAGGVTQKAMGVAQGDVTTDYYTWIQVRGFCDYVRTDGTCTAGAAMAIHSVDEEASLRATLEDNFGTSLVDDGGDASTAAFLYCW
jgi:hypothetical protein